jgi:hypothetical protein
MEELEKRTMDLLLKGDHPFLATLREQYHGSTVRQRDFSGVGFFTFFDVPSHSVRTAPLNFELGDVGLELSGVDHGVGVVLFVRGGYLSFLEGFTYDEPWPASTVGIHYLRSTSSDGGSFEPSTSRDSERLQRELAERERNESA